MEGEFHDWAGALELGPRFVCRHIPRTVNHFVALHRGSDLLQLEVKAGATYRGSVQFRAEDILALSVIDERGFRRLRAGAEGLLKLLLNGARRGGHPDHDALAEKGVRELLEADRDGAVRMARRLGPGGAAALRGAEALLEGGWDRTALLEVEAWAAARALVQPHVIAERVWFRAVRKPGCPVLRTVYRHGRRVPGDLDVWLDQVDRAHDVAGR